MSRVLPILFVLLAFMPQAHGHMGGIDMRALTVCDGLEEGQTCTYRDHHQNLFQGSCIRIREYDGLLCGARHIPEEAPGTYKPPTWEDVWKGLRSWLRHVWATIQERWY